MATPPDSSPGPLKYQTWTLRVPIHCEGCKKKVKKILQNTEGVYMTTIDSQQHKVTVTGNIEAETLLKRLSKSGKPAQLWPEKKEKPQEPPKDDMKGGSEAAKEGGQKPEKQVKKEDSKPVDDGCQNAVKSSADKPENPAPENPNTVENASPVDGGKASEGNQTGENGGGKGNTEKKKKSKGESGNSGNDQNAPAPAPAPGLEPEPAPAPVEGEPPAMPLVDLAKPSGPVSMGPPNELGPPLNQPGDPHPGPGPMNNVGPLINHPGYPPLGPMNNIGPMTQHMHPHLGPMNHQGYMYPLPHHRHPMVGVSYSMSQPSSIGSYYAPPPPPYGYSAYPENPVMYAPPPPPLTINGMHDDYRDHDEDASQCRVM